MHSIEDNKIVGINLLSPYTSEEFFLDLFSY